MSSFLCIIEVNITVSRSQGSVGVVSVAYHTVDPAHQSPLYPAGTVRAYEDDYVSVSGSVVFQVWSHHNIVHLSYIS